MDRKQLRFLPIVIALVVIVYQFFSAEKFVNPETGESARVGLKPQEEQQLGLQAYQQVLRQADVINSGPEVETVRRVARRLAAAASEKSQIQYDWKLSVVRSPEVNAFCLPGGEIVVYTSILPITQNEPGLATVLGHEMAHAVARHGAQRMLQQNLTQTFMMGAQGSLWNMDPQQQQAAMSAIGAAAQYGAILPFNRKHESEADHMGLLYMARAGYDPREAVNFWQRMDERSGGRQPPQFASDHPSHGVRIQQIQGWMPEALKEYEASRMRSTNSPTRSTGM
jgi:predicted Zn-dependent protease